VSWKQTIKQSWRGGLTGAFLAVSLGLSLLLVHVRPKEDFRLGENLIHLSYDIPFRYRSLSTRPQELVLVYLDDDSFQKLGQPYVGPWDRGLYARLLERLTAEKARTVGFDIIFSDPNQQYPRGDESFARAIKDQGQVILGADYQPGPGGEMSVYRALPEFSDAAAGWGFVQLEPDQDFMVRKSFHVPTNPDDDLYSSLSWQLAREAGAPCAQNPDERNTARWVNYYGPPGTIPYLSFITALETNGYCPAGFFSNKVVVVGSSLKTLAANERKDELRTPYTLGSFCPAVDIHATQALNLIRGDWLTRTGSRTEIVLLVLAGLFFGFGLSLFRPLPAVVLAAVGSFGVTLVAHWLFDHERLWFPWMIIVAAQVPVALLWSVVTNSVQLYVQNRLYEHSLRMYLPPKLVKKFSSNKELLKPGARKQELTLFFSDIADFTTISEGMDSDDLAALMNTYFQSAVGDCIHKSDGTVVKYIGDAIFAFWNAPEGQVDHALLACEAALRFGELNRREIHGHRLHTRIGLHSGQANVGNFGSVERVDYTALGENVNLASRLEGLNKMLGTERLISRQTKDEVRNRLVTRALGSFRLKGFESLVEAYELIGWPDQEPATQPWRDRFAEGLNQYQQRNLKLASVAFRAVLELKPEDGPARFYLKQIEERQKEDPTSLWPTYIIIGEK
jgi:adenylate cyclase